MQKRKTTLYFMYSADSIHWIYNRKVRGSIPTGGTRQKCPVNTAAMRYISVIFFASLKR